MHKLQKTDIIDVVQDHGRLHGADGLLHAGQGVGRQRGGLQGRSLQVQNPQSGLKTNFSLIHRISAVWIADFPLSTSPIQINQIDKKIYIDQEFIFDN